MAMTTAVRLEPIEAETMEPLVSLDSVHYQEKSYKGYAWGCRECRLVWEKRWHAEECGKRNHAPQFDQHYGGYVENGLYKGGKSFTRYAIRRERKT